MIGPLPKRSLSAPPLEQPSVILLLSEQTMTSEKPAASA